MHERMSDVSESTPYFEIRAVSRLTGLSIPNIRVWEKRHGVVVPKRSESGRRLYTSADIRRLSLLKSLVDQGNAISRLASLSEVQLEERAQLQRAPSRAQLLEAGDPRPWRVRVVGDSLRSVVEPLKGAEVLAWVPSMEEASEWEASEEAPVDALLIECATLFPDTLEEVGRLRELTGAPRAIVVYRFAQRAATTRLARGMKGVLGLRAPVNAEELRVVMQADPSFRVRPDSYAPLPEVEAEDTVETSIPRKFSDAQLAQAAEIASAIDCECPQHLGQLLFSLTAFEQYSAECESRNAEDEALHRFLHHTTAQARALMEGALERLIEVEEITLEA